MYVSVWGMHLLYALYKALQGAGSAKTAHSRSRFYAQIRLPKGEEHVLKGEGRFPGSGDHPLEESGDYLQGMGRACKDPFENVPLGGEEVLLAFAGIGFLFSYIFAANANLDYVQWFIRSGGNLKLAPDSRTERLVALVRYGPLLLAGIWVYIRNAGNRNPDPWRFPLVLFSSLLATLSFPSFLHLDGYGVLAWVALIPLFMVLYGADRKAIVFYGTVYGTYTSTLINFWLGTFSLVSLQVIILIQGSFYFLFMVVSAPLLHRIRPPYRFVLMAALFTLFEYVRSSGFLGYPWGLFGASQYQWPVILQVAEYTGVWGVSFLVFLWNAACADLVGKADMVGESGLREGVAFSALLVVGALLYGAWVLGGGRHPWTPSNPEQEASVRIALIQQNTDPRKDEYRKTFEVLKGLTDGVLGSYAEHRDGVRKEERGPVGKGPVERGTLERGPVEKGPIENLRGTQDGNPSVDLVVWSETAFVPNIRRWSQEDPEKFGLARLVRDFLAYQKSLGTYLLTGNDDYEVVSREGSEEVRKNYNAALILSPDGGIRGVYHKIKLVPFTEYFPYEKEFPWVYKALQSFDVHFWEPGTEQTVFRHPRFRFSTPICFEDVFPNLVRGFVQKGAELIINISNDYWSLTPVEGKQHAIHALLRAVENRRPLLRATASGWTLYADPFGRVRASLPAYEEGALLVEVPLKPPVPHSAQRPDSAQRAAEREAEPLTFYSRHGDWFPFFCGGVILILMGMTLRRLPRNPQS